MQPGSLTTERDLWQVWEQQLLQEQLATRDGAAVQVVFPGLANADAGPDFVAAQLIFDRQEVVRGDVELHLRASSWEAHGHHRDPRYNDVRLHVVLFDDGGPARTQQDRPIPVLALGPFLAQQRAPGARNGGPCLSAQARRLPAPALRAAIIAAGQARFLERVAEWEQEFAIQSPDTCMLRGLLCAAGLGRNREACLALAQALNGDVFATLLAAAGDKVAKTASALLLGMAGLLEHGRADDEERRIWETARHTLGARPLDPCQWRRFRVRPAHLPETRLRLIAALAARDGLRGFRERCAALVCDERAAVEALLAPLCVEGRHVGAGWALEVWASVLLPLLAACGRSEGDCDLAARAASHYARLPGGGESRSLSRMVAICGLPRAPRAAIEQQGLLHIWRLHCSRQDCMRCPLAIGEMP